MLARKSWARWRAYTRGGGLTNTRRSVDMGGCPTRSCSTPLQRYSEPTRRH